MLQSQMMEATKRRTRLISHSEIQTAQDCWAKWDFQYGGRLTGGDTLKSKFIRPKLSEGRAWGAAVAAWHQNSTTLLGMFTAITALNDSLDHDLQSMIRAGVPITNELRAARIETGQRLTQILDHYVTTATPMPGLHRLEGELNTPLPSRTGRSSSSIYRFHGFIDGFWIDPYGQEWLVEFKLRDTLQEPWLIELSSQIRDYAWARQRESGRPVVGVLVDQRLNALPKPPKIVNARRKADGVNGKTVSHDKDQLTTPELYIAACASIGVEPQPEVVQHLGLRRWQHRHPVPFRPSELDEAGRGLVSAAKLIRDLDSGELFPMRNTTPRLCTGCWFRRICANPQDRLAVDQEFTRTVPKRLREPWDAKPPAESASGTPQPETALSATPNQEATA